MPKFDIFIVGAGTMGIGIANLFLQFKKKVGVYSRSLSETEIITLKIKRYFERHSQLISSSERDYLSNFHVLNSLEHAANSHCVLEAVPENMDVKKAVFQKLAPYLSNTDIIATNTSSLSITELSASIDSSKFLGMHFFNPAPKMKLVEMVKGMATSQQTLDLASEFVRSVQKEPVLVEESPGFIVNRLLIPMINEAVGILAENLATKEDIDKAMTLGTNHPMGPLRLSDFIGNDVVLKVMEVLHSETGDPKYRAHPLLRKYVRSNWLGKKTGQGFYYYT